MAFGSELGSAHISVFPSMKGFRSAVNKEVGASGKAASKTFDSSMNGGKSGGLFGRAFKNGFRQSANDFSADVLKSYERDVAKSTAAYRQAMLQQKAAANQVRAAEESVANAIAKHGEGSTQAEAATIRLEQARLKLSTMTDRATQAENRLKDAQKALKDAQDNLAASSEKTAGSLGAAFRNLGRAMAAPALGAIEKVRAGWANADMAMLDGAGVFGKIGGIARGAFDQVASKASALGGKVASPFKQGAAIARQFGDDLSYGLGQRINGIAAKIPAPFKNAVGSIGGYFRSVGSAASGVFSGLSGVASSVASRMAGALKSGADTAWNAISSMSGKAVGALKGVATVGLAGVGTAVAALAGVGKSALDAYATYEQAVGGVDTLFKDASGTVQKYAAEAYRTAGVSANEYMTQVTSFSASLISSLGGDTAKAAELGNTAMVDMSDNANKMGTDIETIQQTYQSLARGNYAMLDNLKLGYGGTKSEMERLIQDANKVKQANGEMGDLSIDKFSDVVQAIHIMQQQMGISGTTAKEAATTIEGSIGMMKAAWQNWLAELGKNNADINGLTKQLVDSVGTVIQNVGPRIAQIITGITAALPQLFSSLGSTLPALVMQILPPVLGALGQLGTMLLTSATTWISTSLPQLLTKFQSWVTSTLPSFMQTGLTMVTNLLQGIVQALPQIASTAVIVLTTLLDGLSAQLPQLIPIGINAVLNLVQGILNNLPQIIDSGLKLILGLAQGLINALPDLVGKVPILIGQLVGGIINRLPQILQAGVQLLVALANGFIASVPRLIGSIPGMVGQIMHGFTSVNWGSVGLNIITGIATGIAGAAGRLVTAAVNAANNALNWVKRKLGIHSPSRVFRDQVGEMIGEGMAVGIDESASKVKKAAGRLTGILPSQDASYSVGVANASRGVNAAVYGNGGSVTNITQTFNYPAIAPTSISTQQKLQTAAMPQW
jgi:phage-related protein|nr:MAG TPA: tail tape measure protein [Caudoviricetes sp.]